MFSSEILIEKKYLKKETLKTRLWKKIEIQAWKYHF